MKKQSKKVIENRRMVKGARHSMQPPKAKVNVKDAKKAASKKLPAKKGKKSEDDEESKGDHEMTHTEVEDASQEIVQINTQSKRRMAAS